MNTEAIYVICENDYPFMAVDYNTPATRIQELCELFQWYDKINMETRERWSYIYGPHIHISVFYHFHEVPIMAKT